MFLFRLGRGAAAFEKTGDEAIRDATGREPSAAKIYWLLQ